MASVSELWLVDFGEPANARPALILGPPDAFGQAFPFLILAPLTTTPRGLSLHVEVDDSDSTGLVETSYVQCELLRSVSKDRLIRRLGSVPFGVSLRVEMVVRDLLNH